MDWLYGVIGFVVVAAVLGFYTMAKRKQSWSGEVSSVKTNPRAIKTVISRKITC